MCKSNLGAFWGLGLFVIRLGVTSKGSRVWVIQFVPVKVVRALGSRLEVLIFPSGPISVFFLLGDLLLPCL
jgi:hypothetical protein